MLATPPKLTESTDEDFNRRMRNMTLYPEPATSRPPSQPLPYPSYSMTYGAYPQNPHQAVYSPMPPNFSHFPSQHAFYEPPSRPEYSLDTLHHSYAAVRSNQSSSPSAYSMAPHPSTTPRPYGWGSPPMSPAMSSVPFGGMGEMSSMNRGPSDAQHGHGAFDDYGRQHQMMTYGVNGQPSGSWVTPALSSPYTNYTPFQHVEAPLASPMMPQGFLHRGSWTGPHQRPPYASAPNRMSWSGPTVGDNQRERERKAYHPQPPARRSDWVMWVGNV